MSTRARAQIRPTARTMAFPYRFEAGSCSARTFGAAFCGRTTISASATANDNGGKAAGQISNQALPDFSEAGFGHYFTDVQVYPNGQAMDRNSSQDEET